MHLLVSWRRGWDLGGSLQAIDSLSAEDNCLQVAGSLNLEFSLKYGPFKSWGLGLSAPVPQPS